MSTASKEIEIFENTIKALRQIKCEISNVKNDFPISRRQGIGLENAFAFKILEVIKNVGNDNYRGLARPFLYLSDDPNDSFERKKLISFIDNEMNTIKMEIINCSTFCDYYNTLEFRLLTIIS